MNDQTQGDAVLPDPNGLGGFGDFVNPFTGIKDPFQPDELTKTVLTSNVETALEPEIEAVVNAVDKPSNEDQTTAPIEVEGLASIILRARKSPEEVAGLLSTKKVQVAVPIMKPPSKGKYWRVRAGDGWSYQENAFWFLPSDFDSDRKEFLLIRPDLEAFVQSKTQLRSVIKTFGLAFMVDVYGGPAYWALNLGDSGTWGSSDRAIADELKTNWGMICTGCGRHVMERPEDDLGDPLWPEGSPEDWLMKAFKDRIIDSEDHLEIKKLLGKK